MSKNIKISLLLIATMGVMSGITVVSSLPLISKTFEYIPHIEFLSKLLLTIPAITIALFAPIAGIFVDKFGRLKPLYIGILLFVVGGSSGLYLDDFYLILVGRAILGISVALIMTSSTALIGDYFDEKQRHKFMSIQGMSVAFGGIIFITLGGFLAELHWSYPFGIYLIPLLFLPLLLTSLYEPQKHKAIDGEIETTKLWKIYITAYFAMVMFYLLPTQLPYLIIDELQGVPSTVGVVIGMAMTFNALTSSQYSKLKAKLSYTQIYMITFILFGIGLFIISQANNIYQLFYCTIFLGMGFGLILVNTNAWFLSQVPPHKRGKAGGILTSSFFLGQFSSPIIFEPIVALYGIRGLFFVVSILSISISLSIYIYLHKEHNKKKHNKR